jgi:23S rRNA (uracil1939-C5)-methyltransferase
LDVAECPVAVPAIVAALPLLRAMLEPLPAGRAKAAIQVLATPAGLDVQLVLEPGGGLRAGYARLAALAARAGFARLVVDGDIVALTRPPRLAFDAIEVQPPPGAFVQAVAEAEAEMLRLVRIGIGNARRVADLFCGIGTFALPLARSARVTALDRSREAVAALASAARHAQGLKPIETRVRDLAAAPLSARELAAFDAVVLDPPRAGADGQARELARSGVAAVVYVSCNPATLARDARLLVDRGYRLAAVTPIDQFLFSAHVEAVALFQR